MTPHSRLSWLTLGSAQSISTFHLIWKCKKYSNLLHQYICLGLEYSTTRTYREYGLDELCMRKDGGRGAP